MLDDEHAASGDPTGEGDRSVSHGAHRGSGGGGEIQAAMPPAVPGVREGEGPSDLPRDGGPPQRAGGSGAGGQGTQTRIGRDGRDGERQAHAQSQGEEAGHRLSWPEQAQRGEGGAPRWGRGIPGQGLGCGQLRTAASPGNPGRSRSVPRQGVAGRQPSGEPATAEFHEPSRRPAQPCARGSTPWPS